MLRGLMASGQRSAVFMGEGRATRPPKFECPNGHINLGLFPVPARKEPLFSPAHGRTTRSGGAGAGAGAAPWTRPVPQAGRAAPTGLLPLRRQASTSRAPTSWAFARSWPRGSCLFS